jgi:6-phosphofructokinase 2
MAKIVTLTMNPSIDTSSSVDRVVAGRKLRCTPPVHEPGGGGINISRAVRNLGGESVAVYPAGGQNGERLIDLLDAENIGHRALRIEQGTRENFMVYEESTGQQYRFGMPGPTLSGEERQRCIEEVLGASPAPEFIAASGSLPPGVPNDFYAHLARSVRDAGARMILDTSGPALAVGVDAGVYLIKPNLRELQDIMGEEYRFEAQQEEWAGQLIREGRCEVVVISLGAGGAVAFWRDGRLRLRAPTVPIKSKVGAGDSMVGGMVLALSKGMDLPDVVRFGMAAGAAAVMTPGTELCRRRTPNGSTVTCSSRADRPLPGSPPSPKWGILRLRQSGRTTSGGRR